MSTNTQDSIDDGKVHNAIDVEQQKPQQQTGTLLVETPKTLGAGVRTLISKSESEADIVYTAVCPSSWRIRNYIDNPFFEFDGMERRHDR